jgi:hypothetical protein
VTDEITQPLARAVAGERLRIVTGLLAAQPPPEFSSADAQAAALPYAYRANLDLLAAIAAD